MRLEIKQHGLGAARKDLPDVVMIHGTGANAVLWQDEVDLLLEHGYRCFVPDLRGHGDTHEPGEPTGIEEHLCDVLETLEHCDIRYPAIFVGHSLGAIIAVMLAERKPELFQHILAVSMPGKILPPVSGIFHLLLNSNYETLKDTVVHRMLSRRQQVLVETPRHSLQQILHTVNGLDLTQRPLNVKCPVHFSVGRFDLLAPYFYVEQMHRMLSNSTLKIFEWSGHCVMDDAAESYRRWFLDKIQNGFAVPVQTGATS